MAGSYSEGELQQAVVLLQAEFPDLGRSLIETALKDTDLDIPAARRQLLERVERQQAEERQASSPTGGRAASASLGSPTGGDSWFDINKSMRDLGLESLGAQISLFGRQVASSLNAILPPDLNPFGYDEEEYEDELAAAKAADAEREKESKAVHAGETKRAVAARRAGSRGSSRLPTEEDEGGEEEEEDYDKLN